jgi:hypothetical protein
MARHHQRPGVRGGLCPAAAPGAHRVAALLPVRPPAVWRAQAASAHQQRRGLRLGQVGVALRPLARGC